MILKHSMKSIIRTPKKTLLFMFLLIVLTILLSIGAGMYGSAHNMLQDADKTFTSVVELNYLGDPGGDEAGFYNKMNVDLADFDFNKLQKHPNVKAVDIEKTAWAYVNADVMKRSITPLNDYAIVRVGSIYRDKLYTGIVNEVLFGKKARDDAYIMINDMDEQGMLINYNFNYEHEYLVIGQISIGRTATFTLTPSLPEPAEDISCIIDLTENPDFFQTEDGKHILRLQEAMKVVDNSYQVTAITCLEASSPYYFNQILLKEGRIFNPSEYQKGNKEVILISETLADFYQVKTGEMLSLKLHYNSDGIGQSDILKDFNYDYEATYEVIGVFENKNDNKFVIYFPNADWLQQKLHSKIIARYIVKNGTGEDFMKDTRDTLLPNMEFNLYDQGYGEAVKPIIALKNSAAMIIVLSSLSGIVILMLFSYLYVIKQKDTLKSMLSLGTGKRRTLNYILYGSATLVFSASCVGAIISNRFLNKVTGMLFEMMKATYGSDLRYSERSIGLRMNFIPQVSVNLWLPFIVVIVILLVSIILLTSFTYSVLQEDKQVSLRKGKKKVKILLPRIIKVKKMRFGRVRPITLKFALISLGRSPGRSFIIPFLSLILSIFIIFLGLLSSLQKEKLATVYDRIPVTAYLTTPNNETRDIGAINLQKEIYPLVYPNYDNMTQSLITYYGDDIKSVVTNDEAVTNNDVNSEDNGRYMDASKYFGETYLYNAIHYEYMGISVTKEGVVNSELSRAPNVRIHNNSNGFDWFYQKIKQMPKLAYADDIRYTPDFFNVSEPEVEFLEGYSFDSLRQQVNIEMISQNLGGYSFSSHFENIGMVSQNLSTTYGLENGDSIRITGWYYYGDKAYCCVINFKIIGIYDLKWSSDTIYLPWNMRYHHPFDVDYEYITYNDAVQNIVVTSNNALTEKARAVTFKINNTEELSGLRDYLEAEGYSEVGNIRDNRRVIVIQDKRLVETIQNLKNHIRLIDIIKPVMLILFGIIGFAVSYILIKHRMNEFAIMRSMGAKKRQVFFSFFLEQLLLFCIGLVPTAAYALFLPDKINLYGVSLAYFILSYLMGTALALIIMNKAKILEVLFTKE